MRALALALLAGCASPPEGAFTTLTYNVAGLPQGLSSSEPVEYIPQISPKLNAYDLVLVQEDFAYHDELAADVTLPYASVPKVPEEQFVNDGLNRWSVFAFEPVQRTQWSQCYGVLDGASDCLAEKGFSLARTTLAEGADPVELTVVNLHAEAGSGPEDQAARQAGFRQLADALADVDGALLVAGDTNLQVEERPADADILAELLAALDLEDACTTLACGDEHIDRVLLRSGADLTLSATDWAVATEFVTEDGEDLSDHPAIRVGVSWRSD